MKNKLIHDLNQTEWEVWKTGSVDDKQELIIKIFSAYETSEEDEEFFADHWQDDGQSYDGIVRVDGVKFQTPRSGFFTVTFLISEPDTGLPALLGQKKNRLSRCEETVEFDVDDEKKCICFTTEPFFTR